MATETTSFDAVAIQWEKWCQKILQYARKLNKPSLKSMVDKVPENVSSGNLHAWLYSWTGNNMYNKRGLLWSAIKNFQPMVTTCQNSLDDFPLTYKTVGHPIIFEQKNPKRM